MLKVLGTAQSRAFRVWWALEEMGREYERQIALPQSPEVRTLNPLGQVPVMVDGEEVLTDSLAILNYLADREGALTYSVGTPERARMEARINFVLTEMEAPIWLMARHGFVLPKDQRVEGMRPICEAEFARGEKKFAALLGDAEFLAGDRLTLADIIAGQVIAWARMAKMPLAPESAAYLARMEARPAWQRAGA
ncbi:MAG: glutathione S-transferase family protein [Silicimonas sp.]|nr:glutathione S-transferase family protein [Silicimonas sp.]